MLAVICVFAICAVAAILYASAAHIAQMAGLSMLPIYLLLDLARNLSQPSFCAFRFIPIEPNFSF
jgi:hypothetical protein